MLRAAAPFDAIRQTLLNHARRAARAEAERRTLAARDADSPWRHADVLWPHFAKG